MPRGEALVVLRLHLRYIDVPPLRTFDQLHRLTSNRWWCWLICAARWPDVTRALDSGFRRCRNFIGFQRLFAWRSGFSRDWVATKKRLLVGSLSQTVFLVAVISHY